MVVTSTFIALVSAVLSWCNAILMRPSGRTARIGNEGLATSFYNDRDEPLGPFLTKILMECGQDVPDFLQQFKPEGGILNFDEEEEQPDIEDTTEGDDAGDAWGSGGDAGNSGNTGGDGNAGAAQVEAWGSGADDAAPAAAADTGAW